MSLLDFEVLVHLHIQQCQQALIPVHTKTSSAYWNAERSGVGKLLMSLPEWLYRHHMISSANNEEMTKDISERQHQKRHCKPGTKA